MGDRSDTESDPPPRGRSFSAGTSRSARRRRGRRTQKLTREQVDQLLGHTESDIDKMDWDGYSPPFGGTQNTTLKKMDYEVSKDEQSDTEVSDIGNGTEDTVVSTGRRTGRGPESATARGHDDRFPARTSTPNELSRVKTKGLSKSLEKVKSKSKGLLKCFSRDPSVTPPSVIEINSRNVSGYESRRRFESSDSEDGFEMGREEKKRKKKEEKRKLKEERQKLERQIELDRSERELRAKLESLAKEKRENEERIKELESRKRKERSHHSMDRSDERKRAKGETKRSPEKEKIRTPTSPPKSSGMGGSKEGGRERVGAIEAPAANRMVWGAKRQRELAKEQRMQLWEDRNKESLVCHIVRKDQAGMSQDDFNEIHSVVMDAIVDFGEEFGEAGQPESPEGAGLIEKVMRVMVRKESDVEWLRKIVEAMGPYDFLKPGQEVYTFGYMGCSMKGVEKPGEEGQARLRRFGEFIRIRNKFIGSRTFEPVQYIGEINRCGFIKVKMGLSVKAALRDRNNQICLGFGAEVVSYQCPAVLTDPLPDPGMGHKVFRKAGHIGHVKNPDFRRGGLSQKQEKERKRAEEEEKRRKEKEAEEKREKERKEKAEKAEEERKKRRQGEGEKEKEKEKDGPTGEEESESEVARVAREMRDLEEKRSTAQTDEEGERAREKEGGNE